MEILSTGLSLQCIINENQQRFLEVIRILSTMNLEGKCLQAIDDSLTN